MEFASEGSLTEYYSNYAKDQRRHFASMMQSVMMSAVTKGSDANCDGQHVVLCRADVLQSVKQQSSFQDLLFEIQLFVLYLMLPIMEGVAHIHKNEIVHRGISMANILIFAQNDSPYGSIDDARAVVPKLSDFGMAEQRSRHGLPNHKSRNCFEPDSLGHRISCFHREVHHHEDHREEHSNRYDKDIFDCGVLFYDLLFFFLEPTRPGASGPENKTISRRADFNDTGEFDPYQSADSSNENTNVLSFQDLHQDIRNLLSDMMHRTSTTSPPALEIVTKLRGMNEGPSPFQGFADAAPVNAPTPRAFRSNNAGRYSFADGETITEDQKKFVATNYYVSQEVGDEFHTMPVQFFV